MLFGVKLLIKHTGFWFEAFFFCTAYVTSRIKSFSCKLIPVKCDIGYRLGLRFCFLVQDYLFLATNHYCPISTLSLLAVVCSPTVAWMSICWLLWWFSVGTFGCAGFLTLVCRYFPHAPPLLCNLSPPMCFVHVLTLASILFPISFQMHRLAVFQVHTPKSVPHDDTQTNQVFRASSASPERPPPNLKEQDFGAGMYQNVLWAIDGRLIYLFHLQVWQL